MQILYRISIRACTLSEAVENIGLNGQASIIAAGGSGTELEKLIEKFGFKPGFNCKCAQHIREMDMKGFEWCEENIDTINEWLRLEAQRAKLPFTEIGAKLLIRRAINNARKKQEEIKDMTVDMKIEIDSDDVYDAIERTKPKEGKVMAVRVEPPKAVPVPQGKAMPLQ